MNQEVLSIREASHVWEKWHNNQTLLAKYQSEKNGVKKSLKICQQKLFVYKKKLAETQNSFVLRFFKKKRESLLKCVAKKIQDLEKQINIFLEKTDKMDLEIEKRSIELVKHEKCYTHIRDNYFVIKSRLQTFSSLNVQMLKDNFRLFNDSYYQGHYIQTSDLFSVIGNLPCKQLDELVSIFVEYISQYHSKIVEQTDYKGSEYAFVMYNAIQKFLDHIIFTENPTLTKCYFFSSNFLDKLKAFFKKRGVVLRYDFRKMDESSIVDFGVYRLKEKKSMNCSFLGMNIVYNRILISSLLFQRLSTSCWYDGGNDIFMDSATAGCPNKKNLPNDLAIKMSVLGHDWFKEEHLRLIETHELSHLYFEKYIRIPEINQLANAVLSEIFARLVPLADSILFKFEIISWAGMQGDNCVYDMAFFWLYGVVCDILGVEYEHSNVQTTLNEFISRDNEDVRKDLDKIYARLVKWCNSQTSWPEINFSV